LLQKEMKNEYGCELVMKKSMAFSFCPNPFISLLSFFFLYFLSFFLVCLLLWNSLHLVHSGTKGGGQRVPRRKKEKEKKRNTT